MKLTQAQIDSTMAEISTVTKANIESFQQCANAITAGGFTDELSVTLIEHCKKSETSLNDSVKALSSGVSSMVEFKEWVNKLHTTFTFDKAVAVNVDARPGKALQTGGL